MIARAAKYGPLAASAAVLLSLALFVLAGVYTYRQQTHVDRVICAQTVENRRAVRATWVAARRLVVHGIKDPVRRLQTNAFFEEVLRPIPPLHCVDNKPVED